MFRLHYHVSNNGDGSASVYFHSTAKKAEQEDETQAEGWGEPTASYVDLEIVGGKIVRRADIWDAKTKKYNKVLFILESVKEKKK